MIANLTVGVLALQGSFEAHQQCLEQLVVNVRLIRHAEDLSTIDALIIPGGESTTLLKLLERDIFFWEKLQQFSQKKPCLGTCAGAILLASTVENPTQNCLGALEMTVKRNAYGRQLQSAIQVVKCEFDNSLLELVFIRAPQIVKIDTNVEVLAEYNGMPVWVKQGKTMATTFHPELTSDLKVYTKWLENICHDTN